MHTGYAIGVDVGGTKIAAGLVCFPDGQVLARRTAATEPRRGGTAVLGTVAMLVADLAAEAQSRQSPVQAIGISVCELVDHQGNLASANCISWSAQQVHEALSGIAPVKIEADVRAAAVAEWRFGAGRNTRTFLYLTIGTGISSCLVIDGKPFTGARGATGTAASGPLPFVGCEPPASSPTLEELAAGPALIARFNALGGQAQTGQDVLSAATAGDARAIQVIRAGAGALGGTLGLLVNVLDPELVILGGGLGLADGLYREAVIESARRHIWWEGHRQLQIISALTGADAGIIGAATVAFGPSY